MKISDLSSKNRSSFHWINFTAASLLAAALFGCGGGGGGGDTTATAPTTPTAPAAPATTSITAAAALAANDTATAPTAAFAVVQNAGVTPVTVNSAPKVNFTVLSDGAVVKDLKPGNNARFIIAKLVPGSNGNPDKWQAYTYRTRKDAAGTDVVQHYLVQDATGAYSTAANLVYNEAGYYTFTFPIDITDATKLPPGVTYDPTATHRVAIQLSYTNKAGETVRVNPYFDFTIDASGKAVAVTDSSKTRKVVDVSTCNGCHNKLALHGGGRVDTQLCVLCHNPSTIDEATGLTVDFKFMVHKIHAGKFLKEKNGEDYKVQDASFAEVGFPANLRNCAKCHDSSTKNAAGNPLNPQGDNWKTKPSKEVCLSCHASAAGSTWNAIHVTSLKLGASASAISNAACADCHGAGKTWNPEQVHWIQELENTPLYQHNIESVTLTTKPTATTAGLLTVKYSLINPTTGAAYNLREGCAADAAQKDEAGTLIGVKCNTNYRWWTTTPPGKPQDKFGTISLTVGLNDLYTQSTNGDTVSTAGSSAAYLGVDDGARHYTLKVTVPKGSKGNARIVALGSVSERRLDPVSRAPVGAVPPVGFMDIANVPIKNAIYEFNLDTSAKATTERRQIVSNDKCNKCHAFVGIPIKPEPGSDVFHSGVRNNSENCEVCHSYARAGTYTAMTNGQDFNESWNFKRMIHGIHGGSKRIYPYTHGNDYVGEFGKDGKLLSNPAISLQSQSGQAAEVINYTAEVAYPQSPANCNACHVNDSWKKNGAVLGSQIVGTSLNIRNDRYINPGINRLVSSGACVGPTGSVATLDLKCASIDMTKVPVISPKAAVCTSCHDSLGRQAHVINMGGATFGTMNQGDLFAGKVFEACDGCHEARVGALKPVDAAHGLK